MARMNFRFPYADQFGETTRRQQQSSLSLLCATVAANQAGQVIVGLFLMSIE